MLKKKREIIILVRYIGDGHKMNDRFVTKVISEMKPFSFFFTDPNFKKK